MSADAADVHVAMDTAIMEHAALQATVNGRVYSEIAPENTPLPYIRYGSTGEQSNERFGGSSGSLGDKVIDVFAANKQQILVVYGHVYDALHLRRLPLPGDTWCVGKLLLVGTVPDEQEGAHGVVRYTPRVR